jgi:hypothetical protein
MMLHFDATLLPSLALLFLLPIFSGTMFHIPFLVNSFKEGHITVILYSLAECVGLSAKPKGTWCCRYCENRQQRESCLAYNNNAIAAGRVEGVDPLEQIFTRSIRIATTPETGFGGCALCK